MRKLTVSGVSCAPAARRLRRPAAARALLEALEPRTLLTADLTGTFLTAPTRAFSGTSQSVTLSVANSGTTTASGTVAIAFYAAPDGTAFSVGTPRR